MFIIRDSGSAGDDDYSLEGGGVVSFKQDEFEKTISVTLHKDTETEGREEIKLALIPGNALVDVDLNQVITIGILDSTGMCGCALVTIYSCIWCSYFL